MRKNFNRRRCIFTLSYASIVGMHYWQDFLGLNSSSGQSSQYNILLQDYGFESARLYSVVLIHGVSVLVSMVVWGRSRSGSVGHGHSTSQHVNTLAHQYKKYKKIFFFKFVIRVRNGFFFGMFQNILVDWNILYAISGTCINCQLH